MAWQLMEQAAETRRRCHGSPTPDRSLQVGQLVYRRNHNFKGRHKIQDLWLPVPYRVLDQPDNTKPVYTVVPVDESQAPKNIHRMALQPCGVEEPPTPGPVEAQEQAQDESLECVEPEAVLVVRQWDQETAPVLGQQLSHDGLSAAEGERAAGDQPMEESDREQQVEESDSERSSVGSLSPLRQPRRSQRLNAGKHLNPFHLPRSAVQQQGVEEGAGARCIAHTNHLCLVALKEIVSCLIVEVGIAT